MLLTFGRTKCKIRVMYKNGNCHSQWYTTFKTNQALDQASWTTFDQNIKPIVMNIEAVEAIWQTDYRINVFYVLYVNTFGKFFGLFKSY